MANGEQTRTRMSDGSGRRSGGPRIALRAGYHLTSVRPGDRDAYVTHFADGEIASFIPNLPHPYDLAMADAWIRCRMAVTEAGEIEVSFAIREPGGALIGAVGTDNHQVGSAHDAELGYWIGRPYRGRGIASEAVDAFIGHAFTSLRLERLTARTLDFNAASIRVLEKNGFTREGRLRKHGRTATGLHDVVVFGLLRSEWRGV